jgi:hypothetical protein
MFSGQAFHQQTHAFPFNFTTDVLWISGTPPGTVPDYYPSGILQILFGNSWSDAKKELKYLAGPASFWEVIACERNGTGSYALGELEGLEKIMNVVRNLRGAKQHLIRLDSTGAP